MHAALAASFRTPGFLDPRSWHLAKDFFSLFPVRVLDCADLTSLPSPMGTGVDDAENGQACAKQGGLELSNKPNVLSLERHSCVWLKPRPAWRRYKRNKQDFASCKLQCDARFHLPQPYREGANTLGLVVHSTCTSSSIDDATNTRMLRSYFAAGRANRLDVREFCEGATLAKEHAALNSLFGAEFLS
jgi:hypothetical protein